MQAANHMYNNIRGLLRTRGTLMWRKMGALETAITPIVLWAGGE